MLEAAIAGIVRLGNGFGKLPSGLCQLTAGWCQSNTARRQALNIPKQSQGKVGTQRPTLFTPADNLVAARLGALQVSTSIRASLEHHSALKAAQGLQVGHTEK